MKILVTGGSGFIGSNFISMILNQTAHSVINIDKLTYSGKAPHPTSNRYVFNQLDISDSVLFHVFETYRPDYIINFAAETHVDRSIHSPDAFIRTNINGTYALLNSLVKYNRTNPGVRIVHVSTDEVYGDLGFDDAPFTESSQFNPNSPYAASKAAGDHLVRAYNKTYGLPIITTHCGNNYGPYQYPEKLIPVVILKALLNKPIPIYGDGLNVREWIHVEDHCKALYEILQMGVPGERYNIGAGDEMTNHDLAWFILSNIEGSESMLEFVEDRKGHDFRYAIDSSLVRNEFNWKPTWTLENGIRDTINWYTHNIDWVTKCVNLESF